jgi:hypothetical protein
VGIAKLLAEHPPRSACRTHEAHGDVDGGGFARAVGAKKADDLAGLDPQRKIVQGANRLARARAILDTLW